MKVLDNPNTITENLIANSAISHGMRVLDFGCGNGETSKLLAKAVGESGEVVGVDINENAVIQAREKLTLEGYKNCRFIHTDISDRLEKLDYFDAVFGRRVLMYVPDQNKVLSTLSSLLKAGGVICLQESDSTIVPASTDLLPLHDKVNGWVWETVKAEGGNVNTGFMLPSILSNCGFKVESIKAEAIIQGQNLHYPMSTVVRAILPRIVEKGIATESEIDIENLDDRLKNERDKNQVFISDLVFSVIAIKV
ncbi:methyltransferase domain-containing protein [Aestuariicella hydrocarbonica]|uniref:Methyltransferase domain-containing protein n=1 Tax=Pseudomaricurvus hydrocarbonicus TaxID=1470433 RepID=A0A9E5MN68_9GAMM|nr:methyltransferase domain-containing protein [Aestuariicella hydrocarbonica]NHO67315.1 methyltransferase domain-containing protein [Aestuariicella hydrocarbonica]